MWHDVITLQSSVRYTWREVACRGGQVLGSDSVFILFEAFEVSAYGGLG